MICSINKVIAEREKSKKVKLCLEKIPQRSKHTKLMNTAVILALVCLGRRIKVANSRTNYALPVLAAPVATRLYNEQVQTASGFYR